MLNESSCQQNPPRLMLPSHGYRPYFGDFHDIFSGDVHREDFSKHQNKRCVGSSHGWLIVLDDSSPSIFAANPLQTLNWIELPSLVSFPDFLSFDAKTDRYVINKSFSSLGSSTIHSNIIKNTYIKKIFLSKDPTAEGCMAMAIFGMLDKLAFCKVGDREWTVMHQQDFVSFFTDVTFDQQGRFYAVNFDGVVVTGDLRGPSLKVVYTPPEPSFPGWKYLVFRDNGMLMLINRYVGSNNYEEYNESNSDLYDKTSNFSIVGLDIETGKAHQMDSLGGGVLFVGNNQSLYLSSMENYRCAEDCVYFTDESMLPYMSPRVGARDIGVFSMKDELVNKIRCVEDLGMEGFWPPPIWVTLRPQSSAPLQVD